MTSSRWRRGAVIVVCSLGLLHARTAGAADQWIEVKSPHFTITSNAGKGPTATLAWQLEQVRSEIGVLWPWAHVDLNTPLVVFALRDEQSLKTLAPEIWEKNGGNMATVWVSGYHRTFLALRTDIKQDEQRHVNPYATSYFAYFSMIIQQSVPGRLPPWFLRGLSAVMSNTVIQDASILVGPPAPWYLRTVHAGRRIPLADLVAAREGSPLLNTGDLDLFDAEAWALVHYLMFANEGARLNDFGRFSSLVSGGVDPDTAFRDAIGRTADLETPVRAYVDRNLFSYKILQADARVTRESFTTVNLSSAEAAARRAVFHVAMGRPAEARAEIEAARKAGGAADAEVADALLLDGERKDEAARAAFTRAVDAGTTDPYAHYRLASLLWTRDADRETLTRLKSLLSKAVTLNIRYAAAYDFLADVQSTLGAPEPSSLALRAVALEPAVAHHRLTAARVLAAEKRFDDALKQVQAAADLAADDNAARQAAELQVWIQRQKGG
jgi:hypothetical protein